MDKVHKGACSVCKAAKDVVTVSDADRLADVCESCAKKLNLSPSAFLLKYGTPVKKGFFASLFSFGTKQQPAQPAAPTSVKPVTISSSPVQAAAQPVEVAAPTRKPSSTGACSVETPIDTFLELVETEKKIGLLEAARKLNIKSETAETWARILDRRGLITLVYPQNPLETPYVVAGKENLK